MASFPCLRLNKNYCFSCSIAVIMATTPVIDIVKEDKGYMKEEQSVARLDLLPFDHHHIETEHYSQNQLFFRHAAAGSTGSSFTTVTGSSVYAVFPRIEESFPKSPAML